MWCRKLVLAVLVCLHCASGIARAQVVEGQDFVRVDALSVRAQKPIEVIEFFFYGCRSCYLLEPVLQRWLQHNAQQIVFRRVPAMRRQGWRPLGDLFHALQITGLLPRLHDQVYKAIHEDGYPLSSRAEQVDWVSHYGVDAEEFDSVLRSDAVAIASEKSRDATLAYGVMVTPSIVVDGRYLTTGEMIGSASRVDLVLDHLLAAALDSRAGVAQ